MENVRTFARVVFDDFGCLQRHKPRQQFFALLQGWQDNLMLKFLRMDSIMSSSFCDLEATHLISQQLQKALFLLADYKHQKREGPCSPLLVSMLGRGVGVGCVVVPRARTKWKEICRRDPTKASKLPWSFFQKKFQKDHLTFMSIMSSIGTAKSGIGCCSVQELV